MFGENETRRSEEIEYAVQQIHLSLYREAECAFVPRAFGWIQTCFGGGYADYQPIDARYHDFEHTLEGTLCLARLLQRRQQARARPELSQHEFELCLLAILFHDTGYLKRRTDTEGTGAKYTAVHVHRSAEFARAFLAPHGYQERDTMAVQNMIRCTGVNANLRLIPFQSETERVAGFALATADLLGQMAAPDYVDKLPALYQEFDEAVRFDPAHAAPFTRFESAEELMRKTPAFWHDYVWPRLNEEFGKLYTFLNDPYPEGPNPYVRQIEANLERLRQQLAGG